MAHSKSLILVLLVLNHETALGLSLKKRNTMARVCFKFVTSESFQASL